MDNKLLILSQGPHHVAVFKPHNIAVVGGQGVPKPTLLDLVRAIFGNNIAPVHRLDRVTAGITIFARSLFAKYALENAFKKRLVKKTYYALCEGQADFKKKTVDQPLKKTHKAFAKTDISDAGEKAVTNFKLISQLSSSICFLEAQPISGRMHQIRAHCAYLGLPIVGDKIYGAKSICAPHTIALCAVGLSLPLPKGGRLDIDARLFFKPENYLKNHERSQCI
jgi:23S rRNA pseudouridine955/2504/2580 synthase